MAQKLGRVQHPAHQQVPRCVLFVCVCGKQSVVCLSAALHCWQCKGKLTKQPPITSNKPAHPASTERQSEH